MKIADLFDGKDKRWLIEYTIVAHERNRNGLPVWGYREVPEPDSGVAWDNVRDSWRFLDEEPEHCWYEVPYTASGSYGGSVVEEANRKALVELCAKRGLPYAVAYGDHSSETLFVRGDVEDEELIDAINGLESYPCVDDELVSELEHEREQEAWENCYRKDFKLAVEDKFGIQWHPDWPPELEEWEPSDEELDELFEHAKDIANAYWSHETGDSVYIDLERIVKHIEPDDLPPSARWLIDKLERLSLSEEEAERRRAIEAVRNPNQLHLDLQVKE